MAFAPLSLGFAAPTLPSGDAGATELEKCQVSHAGLGFHSLSLLFLRKTSSAPT
jgi:hypothetical protein